MTACLQELIDECRLAVVDMGDNCDVAECSGGKRTLVCMQRKSLTLLISVQRPRKSLTTKAKEAAHPRAAAVATGSTT